MNRLALVIAPLALAGLSACATFTAPESLGFESDRFEELHAGLSQDEVRQLVGKPDITTHADRSGERVWIYERPNAWDSRFEWDVTVGADGKVTDVTAEHE